ncbi:MAG: hypothetical protein CMI75_07410 [Candidatus Pelagibacter sp.]|nr:hypothetical protein [Candidatus Pelagibacter sp.]|tara:strand:+ start:967 stop:1503 length:537 start_codon:yes stop_codon:yes gene_type:complete
MIVIDNFLDPGTFYLLQDPILWKKPLASDFVEKDKEPHNDLIFNVIKESWERVSTLDNRIRNAYLDRAGIEMWTHIISPEGNKGLDWHIDKDETLYEKKGIIETPVYGSIFYCHQDISLVDDMGMLEIGIPPASERIKPLPNRLIVFKSGTPHRVTNGIETSPRKSIVSNIWNHSIDL